MWSVGGKRDGHSDEARTQTQSCEETEAVVCDRSQSCLPSQWSQSQSKLPQSGLKSSGLRHTRPCSPHIGLSHAVTVAAPLTQVAVSAEPTRTECNAEVAELSHVITEPEVVRDGVPLCALPTQAFPASACVCPRQVQSARVQNVLSAPGCRQSTSGKDTQRRAKLCRGLSGGSPIKGGKITASYKCTPFDAQIQGCKDVWWTWRCSELSHKDKVF